MTADRYASDLERVKRLGVNRILFVFRVLSSFRPRCLCESTTEIVIWSLEMMESCVFVSE